MKNEENRRTVLRVPYVSVWDGGIEVETECDVDIKTGEVSNIGCSIIGGLDIREREYIKLDSTQVDVYENEHGFERWADINSEYDDSPDDEIVSAQSAAGEIQAGDMVLSGPIPGYRYLVGLVMEITPLGSDDRETENETDDVYVNFTVRGYSPKRTAEIEEEQSDLYGYPKSFDECSLDYVIMTSDILIRITGIPEEEMDGLLESEERAAAYWLKRGGEA